MSTIWERFRVLEAHAALNGLDEQQQDDEQWPTPDGPAPPSPPPMTTEPCEDETAQTELPRELEAALVAQGEQLVAEL